MHVASTNPRRNTQNRLCSRRRRNRCGHRCDSRSTRQSQNRHERHAHDREPAPQNRFLRFHFPPQGLYLIYESRPILTSLLIRWDHQKVGPRVCSGVIPPAHQPAHTKSWSYHHPTARWCCTPSTSPHLPPCASRGINNPIPIKNPLKQGIRGPRATA